MALARSGTVLLADGRHDTVVPHAALMNMIHAAPRGTLVRWYDAGHELNPGAYHAAFAWLAAKLQAK
jgi:predicted esterase